mmetsp:Transcript_48853/g.100970  ORF Transcript_48853/g.100970 Transcript_48853/m.100970 type:complete len:82 (-) Transcript_48853:50-295(-)
MKLAWLSVEPGFQKVCRGLGLRAAQAPEEDGIWVVSNIERLGSSEVAQVQHVAEAARCLASCEARLAKGEQVDLETLTAAA